MGHLGRLLQSARKRAGLTQRQLADLATVSIRTIRDMEVGRTRNPRRETIRLLTDAMQLNRARQLEIEAAAGLSSHDHSVDDFWSHVKPPPAPLGLIIGREREIATLTERLESGSHRMVTVVGVPGVGKSRLLQEIASRIHIGGKLPVLAVEADVLERHETLPKTYRPRDSADVLVRAALNSKTSLDQLASIVGSKRFLLVINGHITEELASSVLRELLNRCCRLRVLLEGDSTDDFADDVVYPLAPLTVQDDPNSSDDSDPFEYEAFQFLLSRYVWLRPNSAIDARDRSAIASVCRRLDGIPGALESAARWMILYEPSHLQKVAENSPGQLTTPLDGTGQDLFRSLIQILKSLGQSETEVIRALAAVHRSWTIDQAFSILVDNSPRTMNAIHRLRVRGLIRQVTPSKPGESHRFTVLHLIQHIYRDS